MAPWKLRRLNSVAELRASAAEWDDLWLRSTTAAPASRAELIAQWLEHFAPRKDFRAVVVERGGHFVAALPLLGGRKGRLISVGMLPNNGWSACGNLLWDPLAGGEPALSALAAGLRQLPWRMLWLYGVPFEQPQWLAFRHAAEAAGLPIDVSLDFLVGQVDFAGGWPAMQAAWSGNHRRHMRKAARKAEEEGGVTLRVIRKFASPVEVAELIRRGFEVEDRSWKGDGTGSSVLRTPGMLDFFIRQGQTLAKLDQLQLTFLDRAEAPSPDPSPHRGMGENSPIAFEYGWLAKDVYFTPKVGYDAAFSHLSPGQLLRYFSFEQYAAAGSPKLVDFFGPLADATSKWVTRTYPVGRLAVGCGSRLGRLGLSALLRLRGWRRRSPAADPLTPEPALTAG